MTAEPNNDLTGVPLWKQDPEAYLQNLSPEEQDELGKNMRKFFTELPAIMAPFQVSIDRNFGKLSEVLANASGFLRDVNKNHDYCPENWKNVGTLLRENEHLNDEEIDEVVVRDGIPTAWVIPQDLLHQMLLCRDKQERCHLLQKNKTLIIQRCSDLLDGVTGEVWEIGQDEFDDITVLAKKAVKAYQSGHFEASQSLATSVIDTLLRYFHGTTLNNDRKSFKATLDVESTRLASYIVFGPLYTAYAPFWRDQGHVPEDYPYNRNVSTHAASTSQYSKLHALFAVMNMTAIVIFTGVFGDVDVDLILAPKAKGIAS